MTDSKENQSLINDFTIPDTNELFSTFSNDDDDTVENIIIDTTPSKIDKIVINQPKSKNDNNNTTCITKDVTTNNSKIDEDIHNFYKACQSTVIVPINYTKLSFNQKKVVQDTIKNLLINLEILGESEKKEKEERKLQEYLEQDEMYAQSVIDDLNKKREIVMFLENLLSDENRINDFFINSLVNRSKDGFIKLVYLNKYLANINLNVANYNNFDKNPDVQQIRQAVSLMSTYLELNSDGTSIRYNRNNIPFYKYLENYSIELTEKKEQKNDSIANIQQNIEGNSNNIPNIPTLDNNNNDELSKINENDKQNVKDGIKKTITMGKDDRKNEETLIQKPPQEETDESDMEISDSENEDNKEKSNELDIQENEGKNDKEIEQNDNSNMKINNETSYENTKFNDDNINISKNSKDNKDNEDNNNDDNNTENKDIMINNTQNNLNNLNNEETLKNEPEENNSNSISQNETKINSDNEINEIDKEKIIKNEKEIEMKIDNNESVIKGNDIRRLFGDEEEIEEGEKEEDEDETNKGPPTFITLNGTFQWLTKADTVKETKIHIFHNLNEEEEENQIEYDCDRDIVLGEENKKDPFEKEKFGCFNCRSIYHELNDCPLPRNPEEIKKNRALFKELCNANGNARYHEIIAEEEIYSKFKPGEISDTLREALGLEEDEVPLYVQRMDIFGYPPGYLGFTEKDDPYQIRNFDSKEEQAREELKIYSDGQEIDIPVNENKIKKETIMDNYDSKDHPEVDEKQKNKTNSDDNKKKEEGMGNTKDNEKMITINKKEENLKENNDNQEKNKALKKKTVQLYKYPGYNAPIIKDKKIKKRNNEKNKNENDNDNDTDKDKNKDKDKDKNKNKDKNKDKDKDKERKEIKQNKYNDNDDFMIVSNKDSKISKNTFKHFFPHLHIYMYIDKFIYEIEIDRNIF
ncbi:hypothetical protein U3516DRAFT_825683 [Neocallimastix sp. 'constans']